MGEFVVRLVMKVEAEVPEQAVLEFIGHMVENGLTSWVYRVEDPETHTAIGYFDGHGTEIDIEQEAAAGLAAEAQEQAEPVSTPVQTESDADLHSLAESLNDSDQPEVEQQAT